MKTSSSQTGGMYWGKEMGWGEPHAAKKAEGSWLGLCVRAHVCQIWEQRWVIQDSVQLLLANKVAMKIFFISHLTLEMIKQLQRKQRWGHDQLSKSKGVFLANVPILTSLFLLFLAVNRFPPSPKAKCNSRVKQKLNDTCSQLLKYKQCTCYFYYPEQKMRIWYGKASFLKLLSSLKNF